MSQSNDFIFTFNRVFSRSITVDRIAKYCTSPLVFQLLRSLSVLFAFLSVLFHSHSMYESSPVATQCMSVYLNWFISLAVWSFLSKSLRYFICFLLHCVLLSYTGNFNHFNLFGILQELFVLIPRPSFFPGFYYSSPIHAGCACGAMNSASEWEIGDSHSDFSRIRHIHLRANRLAKYNVEIHHLPAAMANIVRKNMKKNHCYCQIPM